MNKLQSKVDTWIFLAVPTQWQWLFLALSFESFYWLMVSCVPGQKDADTLTDSVCPDILGQEGDKELS